MNNKRTKQFLWQLLLLFFTVVVQQEVSAQTRKISGTVTDEKGLPVAGASVTVAKAAASSSAATDPEGIFTFSIDASYKTLRVTSVGYIAQSIPIGSKTVFNIVLKSDAIDLSDVVVVAYGGVQKKASVTAAISTISAKEIVQSPVANISNGLAGRLPV